MIKNLKIELLLFGILFLSIFLSGYIDIYLYRIFNDFSNLHKNIYFKEFFIHITELGNSLWYFLILLILFILSLLSKKIVSTKYEIFFNKLKTGSLFFFTAILISGGLTQIIKHILGKPRPNVVFLKSPFHRTIEGDLDFSFFSFDASMHSFPSGHTSTIIVIALCFSLLLPKIKYFFIFFASIIAFSRVIVGAHFFTDIIGGIIVAYFGFKITRLLFNRLNIKLPLPTLKELNSDHIFLALVVFFIISLFLAIGSSMDIYVSNFFYFGKQQFALQKSFAITVFFRKIFLPLIILYLIALPIISIYLQTEKFYFNFKFKIREVLFIFGSFIFNLILVVNILLKSLWGRARPGDISQFGGEENFTSWIEVSKACYTNCSFVSGDASVGFSLVVLFFLTKNKIFFWGSLFAGLSIGLIRIMEGGHFLSDVVVSGLVIYLLTYIQYYLFNKKYAN